MSSLAYLISTGAKKATDAVNNAVSNVQRTTQGISSGTSGGGSTNASTPFFGGAFNAGLGNVANTVSGAINNVPHINDSVSGIQPVDTQQPTTTQADPTADYINQLKEAQKASRIAELDKAKTSALSALNTEQANIEPMYYDKRNQAASNSDVGALNFAQYMATRGIKGNAGAMPEIYRNAGLQGQIGALDQQQAQANVGIENQRANINTGYASDVANANADVESQAMQNMIDQFNKNKDYNLQQAQLTGNLNGTPTLAATSADRQYNLDTANQTGYFYPLAGENIPDQYKQQLTPYMGDLQALINSTSDPTLKHYAEVARQQKLQSSPDIQNKYGQQYQTTAGMNAGLQNKALELNNVAQQIQNSSLPETLKLQTQRLMQQVKAGTLDYDQALAQLNQTKAQTNATNAGVEQGWAGLTNDAAKLGIAQSQDSAQAIQNATDNAYKYFDSLPTENVVDKQYNVVQYGTGLKTKAALKNQFNNALNEYLATGDPYGTFQKEKQAIYKKYPDTGNYLVNALENALGQVGK